MALQALSSLENLDSPNGSFTNFFGVDGITSGSPTPTAVTDNRPGSLGTKAMQLAPTISAGAPVLQWTSYGSADCTNGRTHWIRFWIKHNGILTSSDWGQNIFSFIGLSTQWDVLFAARSGQGGYVEIRAFGTAGPFAISTGRPVATASQWYKVDIQIDISSTSGASVLTVSIDDVVAVTANLTGVQSTANTGSAVKIALASQLRQDFSPFSNVTGGATFTVDDLSWRDNSGSNCNTAPSDSEQISVLLPTADSAISNWTGGGGAVTNVFDNVNNTPPVGVATAAAGTQAKNVSKTVPDTLSLTCAVSGSVTAGSTALGIVGAAWFASPQTKNALNGHVVVSGTAGPSVNPNLSQVAATWPTGWTASTLAISLNAAVAVSYTMGATKETSSTSELDCCAAFGYLLSIPPVATVTPVVPVVVSQAVARASAW